MVELEVNYNNTQNKEQSNMIDIEVNYNNTFKEKKTRYA